MESIVHHKPLLRPDLRDRAPEDRTLYFISETVGC